MSSMESMNNNELGGENLVMYNKYISRNPDGSKEQWEALKEIASNAKSSKAKDFFAVNGILMEEKPTPEEIAEMKDIHSHD